MTRTGYLRPRFRLGCFLSLMAITALVIGVALRVRSEVLTYLNSYVEKEVVEDGKVGRTRFGTALRTPKGGIFFGSGRYYVVFSEDETGERTTLYTGPGLYPDPPPRPKFLGVEADKVYYDTPTEGRVGFGIPRKAEADSRQEP
ncbi:MAG: hypothetical protein U0795_19375 [Pirellulales bacterium]